MDEDLVSRLVAVMACAMAEAREHREEELQAEGLDQAEVDAELIVIEAEHFHALAEAERELRCAAEDLANGRAPAPGVLH